SSRGGAQPAAHDPFANTPVVADEIGAVVALPPDAAVPAAPEESAPAPDDATTPVAPDPVPETAPSRADTAHVLQQFDAAPAPQPTVAAPAAPAAPAGPPAPSAWTVTVSGDTAHAVVVAAAAGNVVVTVDGVADSRAITSITSVSVSTGGGADTFKIDTSLASVHLDVALDG